MWTQRLTIRAWGPVVLAAALVLTACGGQDEATPADTEDADETEPTDAGDDTEATEEASGDPLRIAIVTSQAGAYASIGEQSINAGEFAVKWYEERGGPDGRTVEVVTIDDQGTPEGAVEGVERAILQENAPFITGTVASSQGLAIAAQIEGLDGIYVASINKTDALTGEACNPRVFRSSSKDSMDLNAVGPWLEGRSEETWSAIGADYEWGHDSVGQFKQAAEQQGFEVVGEHYPALGETDYGSVISQVNDEGAQGLWVSLSGGDSVTFIQQAEPFGLFDQKDVVIGNNFITDSVIGSVGELAEGIWGTVNYHHSIDTPTNQEFVEAWNEEYGANPTNFEGETFMAIQMLVAGADAADSVEPADVAAAMNDLEVDTLLGNLTIRGADGDLLTPNFLGVVAEADGGYDWDIQVEVEPEVASPEPNPACTGR